MKETPTEERLEKGTDGSLPELSNGKPAQQSDKQQPSITTKGNQPKTAAPDAQHSPISSSQPKPAQPASGQTDPSPTTQHSPPSPPRRTRWGRKRGPYTRREKVIIWSAAVVAIVALLPLVASLLLQNPQSQQAQHPVVSPTGTAVSIGAPRILDPERREALFIDQMIAHMTLDEELGQMIMVEWDEGGAFNHDLQYMLTNQHAGGIILYTFNNNIQTRPQVTALTAAIQAHAQIPLLISIDQEGGNVNRLDPITGPRPSAREIGATNDPNRAYQQGVSDGQILKQLGINDNLAPDVDVQSLSDATFDASSMVGFEYRMYGNTPGKVSTFAGAYLNGLQDQGVLGTLKHWPGLGADTVDPHEALPTLLSSQQELNLVNFAPYRTLIAQGNVDMIMSTHELVPAYDKSLPATLSPVLINQVLRQQLGYQGVVITDGLYMKAISDHWTLAQAAVLAVLAGNDILLGPYNIQTIQNVLDALHAAVTNGQITKARIDLSMQRILALKIKYGLITVPTNFGQN